VKIVFLSPGTGSYYCGACMRDNALARELHRSGHDVTIAPMYLPLSLDEQALEGLDKVPVFFGGINVFLQQKASFFRKTPRLFDRLLNAKWLLRWAARHSHMTSAREHGEMTQAMLDVGTSRLRKELDKLCDWLEQLGKPDVICLSTALLAGLAPELKARFGVPVVVFFQGEDTFLDSLPRPWRGGCWLSLTRRLPATDLLISPSRAYAELMRSKLGLARGRIEVLHNGISLEGYAPPAQPPATPAIGYLGRMSREKGVYILLEAFFVLALEKGDHTTRLRIAGTATAGDEPFIREMKRRISNVKLDSRVDWLPNLTREQKIDFLRGLTLFSVPVTYEEAFGLYVIEAMACGVPVVQPESASFPEIIAATGGGVCVRPRHPDSFANAWHELLQDPARRAELGQSGRLGVEKRFTSRTMAAQFDLLVSRLLRPKP
jgi:glycosyltransferase involved in cell wall biosynthesis